ncbi:MAG: hypothetical protein IJK65_03665 [Clostridiales bacterium]|nr:hypothetical protein [Clostridiales bacterium]
MKSKKVLATVLSVVMSVASLPCIVMADSDHDSPEVDFTDTEPTVSLDLSEGVSQTIDLIESGETKIVSFTPSTNGRYGLMCTNAYEVSVSVEDQYRTVVVPAETESYGGNLIQYMTLDAGMKYLFSITGNEGSSTEDMTLMIGRSSKTLHLGTTYVFAETRTTKDITFTPSESGVYVFTVTAPEKVAGRIHLGGYSYAEDKDYSDSSIYIYTELAAGVTYPLKLDLNDYSAAYGICNPMKITVAKDLPLMNTGKNSVTVKANNQDTYFQFVPQEDGVYQIYTKGDHSTQFSMDGFPMEDHHYGEDNNFSTGVCLKAGKVYFPTIKQSGSSEETIDVYIEKAPEITDSQTGYTLSAGDALFYSFTPSKSGFYRFYSNVATVYVRNTKFGDSGWSTDYRYFNAGETSMIWVVNDTIGNIGFAWLYVEEIANTIDVGNSNIDNSKFESHVYALFTPTTSGKYTFDIPVGYARFTLIGETEGQVGYFYDYTSEGITGGCALTAGKTYLLDVNLNHCSGGISNIPVQITKESLPKVKMGDNPVSTQRTEDTYYSFTPYESGVYEFCYYLYPSNSPVTVQNGTDYGTGTISFSAENFNTTIISLEANTEYTVVMPSTWEEPAETTLHISKIAQLKEGENQVDRPMPSAYRSFYALFTPKESGIYTFTNGSSSFYTLGLTDPDDDFMNSVESAYTFDNRSHFLLEAGKRYLVAMTVTDAINPTSVVVTKDQALNVGTNSVHIPAPEDEDNPYAYFSFTAPAQGGYVFSFVNADLTDTALYAGLYSKTSNRFETSGYLHNGNPTVGNHLEKGETYRLRVKLDPNTNGEDLDIIIRAEYFYESKLDGYTLSLDGTIAVNLYMTLSEEMASSTSARMNITYENGATDSYKMSDATPVTVTGKTYYVFHIPVAAKEMTSVIKAQIVDGEFEGNEYSFTVKDYADHILNGAYTSWGGVANQEYADAVPLVKALLNYGAYSQQYFGYKTDDLANKDLNDNDQILPTLNPNSIPGYNSNLTNLPSGVTFKSVSLSLESETELNLTFTNTTGKALSFTTDNEFVKLKVTTSGDQTKLKITGIPAHKVNEKIDLKVFLEGESDTYYVSYSPIYYCRNQIERPVSPTRTKALKDLMAAFYLYNQAARNYIDN